MINLYIRQIIISKEAKKVIQIKKINSSKYFFLILFIIIIILSVFLVKPFLTPVLTSLVVAYMFYPIYKWLNKKLKRKNLSAL